MNIVDYINRSEVLSSLPFLTVYKTIATLIEDGYIMQPTDVVNKEVH